MMKKKYFLTLALLALVTACDKENDIPKTFTAGMEQCTNTNDKMHLDGNHLKWDGGEKVMVFTHESLAATFNVTPQQDATKATLTYESGSIYPDGPYIAVSPASIASSTGSSVKLPTIQVSPDGSLREMPMVATSENTSFQFHNLCGVMKVHLQQSGVSINSIRVTANRPLAGSFDIDGTTTEPILTATSENNLTMTILRTNVNQDITNGKDFYICIPAGSYDNMNLEIINGNGGSCIKRASNVTIVRNTIHPISVTNMEFDESSNLLPGEFSVSPTRTVRFAKGNLQYQACTDTWCLATKQYDAIWDANKNILADSYMGWIDLFGWSTTSNNFGVSVSCDESDYQGDFVDWGTVFGQNSPWRTLSLDEWEYLRYHRTDANSLWGAARIEISEGLFMNGVVILPDNWSSANGLTFTGGTPNETYVPSLTNWYSRNSYTLAQWEIMENHGAIFLPAAGSRRAGNDIDVLGSQYRYWTSSEDDQTFIYEMGGDGYMLHECLTYRFMGDAVRLVQDVN